jgi:hypothetical protein
LQRTRRVAAALVPLGLATGGLVAARSASRGLWPEIALGYVEVLWLGWIVCAILAIIRDLRGAIPNRTAEPKSRAATLGATFLMLVVATAVLFELWLGSGAVDCSPCSTYSILTAVATWYLLPPAWLAWIAFATISGARHLRQR